MKNTYYILFLVLAITGCSVRASKSVPHGFVAQKDIAARPFQVVYAENTRKIGSTTELTALEYLTTEDIVLLDSGYLTLAHFSGLFLEFEGDTSITIWNLYQSVNDRLNIDLSQVKHRADVGMLRSEQTRRNQYFYPITRHPATYLIDFICPVDNAVEISANNPEVCISWKHSLNHDPSEYEIQLKNIFDEPVDTLYSKEPFIALDVSRYENEEGLIIAKVSEVGNSENRSADIGIQIGSQQYYTPAQIPDSSVKAIEMAFYLESQGYYHHASDYYKLAAAYSDRPIYNELLELHNKRE